MPRALKNNGLSIVLLTLFLVFWAGQAVSGWLSDNQDRAERHQPARELVAYLRSGEFVEATAENWESEFLQMAAFVLLSGVLIQRGSPESKRLEEEPAVEAGPDSPWPLRRGGLVLKLYDHSLSIALGLLFMVSFAVHALGGVAAYNDELLTRGGTPLSAWQFMGTPTFWFQSLQNWQSEFLATGALVLLTIFLRERGSPQSKPVAAPHAQTGS